MKERETLFNEYVTELKKANRHRAEEQKQSQKTKAEKVMECNWVEAFVYCGIEIILC